METPDDTSHKGRRTIDIHSVRARGPLLDEHGHPYLPPAPEGESSYGPLKPEESEFYGRFGDMREPEVDDDDWLPTADDLAAGDPEPDDPDARASGAVWTGRYWRPRGRPVDRLPRTPLCPTDFTQMEVTTVGWLCPDCGLVKL
ncbi:hypothetical protein [Naasia lichenicola]|uniref:Uncharacterized protein n=1 Tax=Naasia lichenicola TaxID=2565933 RepID=A0A4V3WTH9_9MICO|nr:hypothetical protein [Naasia lichenicola]THG30760.1 hypothetical protein E6C64_08970 [Naasia lichenicola]THG31997.1 hypothetical protein E6C64_08115 [Naasia lichenicola]